MANPEVADPERQIAMMKEFLKGFNTISETCFMECASDFTTRKVGKSEENCTKNCVSKYLSSSQIITQKFMENPQVGGGQPPS